MPSSLTVYLVPYICLLHTQMWLLTIRQTQKASKSPLTDGPVAQGATWDLACLAKDPFNADFDFEGVFYQPQ